MIEQLFFSEEEQELLRLFPSPSNRVIRNNLVANKADWQYTLSARVLQLAIKDLDKWMVRPFLRTKNLRKKILKRKNEKSENHPFVLKKSKAKL